MKHYQHLAHKNHSKILNNDQVVDICLTENFDPEKIDAFLERYNAPKKYQDLEEFNWHQTQTREQKEKAKRDRVKEMERQRQDRQHQREQEELRRQRRYEATQRRQAREEEQKLRGERRAEKAQRREDEKRLIDEAEREIIELARNEVQPEPEETKNESVPVQV